MRAAASAAIIDVEAVSSMWPCQPRGNPSSCASQSSTVSSSSVAAGDESHVIPFTFSAAISSSARIPGSEPVFAIHAKNRGWFQCVSAGRTSSSRSRSIASNVSPCSGAASGSCARSSPGATVAATGSSPTRAR